MHISFKCPYYIASMLKIHILTSLRRYIELNKPNMCDGKILLYKIV